MGLAPRIENIEASALGNYLINGGLDWWQRAPTFSGDNLYTADRFRVRAVDANASVTRNVSTALDSSDYPSINGIRNSAVIGTLTSNTTRIGFGQFVERKFCSQISGKTVTFSFYIKRLTTESADVRLKASVRSFSSADSISGLYVSDSGLELEDTSTVFNSLPLNTWSRVSYTFLASSVMATNGFYAALRVENSTGTGIVNLSSTTSLLKVAGLMVSEGATANTFTLASRDPIQERLLCMRYYYSTIDGPIGYTGIARSATAVYINNRHPVKMRATPALSGISGNYGVSDGVADYTATTVTPTLVISNVDAGIWSVTGFSGMTAGRAIQTTINTTGYLTADAEF